MQTTDNKYLTDGLIHCIRGELTKYQFDDSEESRDKIIKSIAHVLDRVDAIRACDRDDFVISAVPIKDLIESILANFSPEDIERIKLNFKSPVTVRGNTRLLGIAFYELLKNALDYSTKEVIVSLVNDQSYLTISVEDFGLGISAEIQDKITEPFVRSKSKNRGHGLGLYLAWRIVRSHGNEMNIASNRPGTRVSVILDIV